jgi:hypothetical protein
MVALFVLLKGMTGALAPFSYLVYIYVIMFVFFGFYFIEATSVLLYKA